jgi:hypothetical protein
VPDAKKVDMAELVAKIDARLNSGPKVARVTELPGRRIEVALYSPDEAVVENVGRLLQCDGILEFRVLANDRDDKAVIERAKAASSKTKVLDDKGHWLARWVPIRPEDERTMAGYGDIALRKRKAEGREVAEGFGEQRRL